MGHYKMQYKIPWFVMKNEWMKIGKAMIDNKRISIWLECCDLKSWEIMRRKTNDYEKQCNMLCFVIRMHKCKKKTIDNKRNAVWLRYNVCKHGALNEWVLLIES